MPSTKNVLVAEDDRSTRELISKTLAKHGFIVQPCIDGFEALAAIESSAVDLVIADYQMPKMDGLELCQELREYDKQTPVLMLTAKTQVKDRVEGLKAGADDYLGKPFAFEELLARIQALIRRKDKAVEEVIKIDSLEIDTANFTVTRAGASIDLSPKEYALLGFLARNRNQIMSAMKLAERVWSYESDVLPNTAQVYIGYLRKKIDKDFPNEKPLIKTVRGFGYKLLDE